MGILIATALSLLSLMPATAFAEVIVVDESVVVDPTDVEMRYFLQQRKRLMRSDLMSEDEKWVVDEDGNRRRVYGTEITETDIHEITSRYDDPDEVDKALERRSRKNIQELERMSRNSATKVRKLQANASGRVVFYEMDDGTISKFVDGKEEKLVRRTLDQIRVEQGDTVQNPPGVVLPPNVTKRGTWVLLPNDDGTFSFAISMPPNTPTIDPDDDSEIAEAFRKHRQQSDL